MSIDINKVFEVGGGGIILREGGAAILCHDGPPDFVADIGTIYYELGTTNVWQNRTGLANGWRRIDSLSSPGFTWGRGGTTTGGTWLQNDSVPSNMCGRVVLLNDAVITKIYTANEDAVAIKFGVYSHDGNSTNLTLLGTVTTAAQRSNVFDVSFSVDVNKQLALRVESDTSNSAKNPVVGVLIEGNQVV